MTSDTRPEVRCTRCGHTPGYHGATFCNIPVGTGSRPQCDCPGWSTQAPDESVGRLREALHKAVDRLQLWTHMPVVDGRGEQRHRFYTVKPSDVHAAIDATLATTPQHGPVPVAERYSFEPLTGDGWAISGPGEQERHADWTADGYGLAIALDRETAVLIVDALNKHAPQHGPVNAPQPDPTPTFTGQDEWPCLCGHKKASHYFGDAMGQDGTFGTWCQLDHCRSFRPASQPPAKDADPARPLNGIEAILGPEQPVRPVEPPAYPHGDPNCHIDENTPCLCGLDAALASQPVAESHADAELIVAMRNAAPLLLDVLDAARELARLGGTFVVDEHQFHEIRKASGRQLGVLRAALNRYESATLESGAL